MDGIPEAAEESRVWICQADVQIIAESRWDGRGASTIASLAVPENKISDDADYLAAIVPPAAPGACDAHRVVGVGDETRIAEGVTRVPYLHLINDFVVLRQVDFGNLDVCLGEVEPASGSGARRRRPCEPELIADLRRSDDPVVLAD